MISLRRISKTYPVGKGLTVLRDVTLDIAANDYLGIVGPSGSGKSTLLHIMGLLDRPTEGTLCFRDRDTSGLKDGELSLLRGRSIGFVFQSFHLVSQLTVTENVELPLLYQRVPARQRRRRAKQCLADVGLAERARHLPSQLSGGESQRVAIARAIAPDPDVILADEPTGNLDTHTGREIMDILDGLHERGCTIVMITHDPSIAARIPRIVRMRDGVLHEEE